MSGRLKHRPQPQSEGSSRQTGLASSAQAENGGSSPTNVEDDETNTRARNDDRLEEAVRPRIVPAGNAFEVYPYITSRRPSTVQGALLRRFYPGAIGLPECRKPALTWGNYNRSANERIISSADRVLKEFWYHFKCDPTDKAEADKVLEQNFKKKVPQMLFEEKKRATNKLYKNGNVPAEDVDEDSNHWPTVEALISAKPKDFSVTQDGWRLLCEHWSTPEFRKKSLNGKRNRLAGGDTVYQCGGSRGLVATKQYLQHKKGGQQGLAAAWQHTRRMQQGENQQLCNQRAQEAWGCLSRGMEREYGPNWQVKKPDLDANVIYNSTGRMPHGRLAIANEAISNKDKDAIKSRKRNVTPPPSRFSAREIYQQKKIKRLERDIGAYRSLECVVRALAAKSGLDYDTLMKQYAPELASSTSDVGSTPDHHEAEYQHDQGGNEIGEDEGNDFDQEGDNEIPEDEGNGDDTDGDYGMYENDYENIDLWMV